ncbi:WD40-repeat-containing domain protein [Coemansia spiralis]|nr:WD40-repeat-containing domain protein [Coemansia spiralis]
MEDPTELLDSKAELDQEEMERLLRENRALKGRLDDLERENRLLKQRNFDLSMRYGRNAENRRQPFEIVFSDSDVDDKCEAGKKEDADEEDSSNASDNNEGSGAGYSLDGSECDQNGNSGIEDTGQVKDTINSSNSTPSMPPDGPFVDRPIQSACNSAVNGEANLPALAFSHGNSIAANTTAKEQPRLDMQGPHRTTQDRPQKKYSASAGSASAGAVSAGKEKGRDRQKRIPEVSDADRDGSAKYADVESAAPKEKRGSRESEEQRLGAAGGSGSSRRKEAKQLKCYAELDGHEGAVYSTQYSPSGSLIASASFDKTVRIWDVSEQKPFAVLDGHQQSVFDVAWRYDSAAVVSAGFDRKCIEWDLESKKAATELPCDGLVQCVRYSTHNSRIIYSGDSSGFISIHDTRQPQGATKLYNDGSMVNTIFCFNDETRLVSGDRNGEIKMWDVRIGRFMRLVSSSAQSHAISHISVVKNEKSGTEYMATNSYDNVLRVYDRVDDPSVPTPRVIHELRGIRSRNWPIKNAFLDPRIAQEQLVGLYDDDYYELDTRLQNEARGLRSMLFLITGSAEPFAYLYKLGTHSKMARVDDKTKRGSRQRLEGHSDRVYAVATHPTEIKACTAGADGTIRLWHIPSAGRLLKDGGY